MKVTKMLKSVLFTAVILANGAVFAYSPDELAKECHKPKFTDFTLSEYKMPEKHEVAAEAEFSFKVPAFTSAESIKLTIKDQPIAFTVESNSSFHKVRAKLPAEYTGKFVRLNVSAKVSDGICHDSAGWLLKITDKAPAEAVPAVEPDATITPAPAEASPAPAK